MRIFGTSFGKKEGGCTITDYYPDDVHIIFKSRLTDWKMRMEVSPVAVDILLHHILTHKVQVIRAISFQKVIVHSRSSTILITNEPVSYKIRDLLALLIRQNFRVCACFI